MMPLDKRGFVVPIIVVALLLVSGIFVAKVATSLPSDESEIRTSAPTPQTSMQGTTPSPSISPQAQSCKNPPACVFWPDPCDIAEPQGGWCKTPKPSTTCVPRPACLDQGPRSCKLPEPQEGWCPTS